jgi:phosphatidylserine decarboxylase
MPKAQSAGGPTVYDRRAKTTFEEVVLGDRLMRWAYEGPMSGLLRRILFQTGFLSRVLGVYADSFLSRGRIRPTIEGLGIDESEFAAPTRSFRTFNEFFCRHLRDNARPFDPAPDAFCSPADCRLLVIDPLRGKTCVPVKGAAFSLPELFGPGHEKDAAEFAGGSLAVFRLCPADYHRYHFPADGHVSGRWHISGRLDSVNPLALALNIPVFTHNKRIVTLLDLDRFGPAAFIEVGAFGVGAIEETHSGTAFAKGDEKGVFKFGGSTIIVILRGNVVRYDSDILTQSRNGVETRVLAGERIAVRR